MHHIPTNAKDGLDPLQIAFVMFSCQLAITDLQTHDMHCNLHCVLGMQKQIANPDRTLPLCCLHLVAASCSY